MKTKKLKRYLKSVIILSCILLITYNCEKDNYEVNPENSEPIQIEHLFNQSDFSNLIPYEYTVDLDNPKKLYSDELKSSYYEFSVNFTSPFNPNQLNKVQQKGGYYTKYKVMATVNDTGESNFYTIKFYQNVDTTNDSLINSEVSFSNSENFTGIVHLLDRNKKLVFSKKLNKGNLIDIMPFKKKRNSNSSLASREEPNCETIAIPTYTDWYKVYTIDHTTYIEYTHTQFTGYDYEEVCISNGGSLPEVNPYGYNSEGIYTKKTTGGVYEDDADVILIENEVEYKIDNEQLTGKEKCIDNLLTENGNDFIKNLLNNFDGDDSEFDIVIKSASELLSPSGGKDKGQTHSPNSNNEIIIEISSSSINSMSALETAKTILHEYIHADIFRKLLTEEDKTNPEILSFQDTYNKYKEQFKDKLTTTVHQTMGYLYVNSMRDALKDFHKNVLKSDYQSYINNNGHTPTDLFYEALAWRGLKEHNVEAYKDIDPEKIEQLEAIDLRIDELTKDCKDAQ